MKLFVYLSGLLNITMALLLSKPQVFLKAGIKVPGNALLRFIPASGLITLGLVLFYCARDLQNRASLVLWDGVSRVSAFFGFVWLGLVKGLGIPTALLGVLDLGIALVYFTGLPRSLKRSFLSILLNRHA